MKKLFMCQILASISFLCLGQSVTTVSLSPVIDSWIDNVATTTANSSTSPLYVDVSANGASYRVKRSLIRFNVDGTVIPSKAVIVSARLDITKVTETNVTNSNIKLERIDPILNTSLWTSTVTWATQPVTITSDLISTSSLTGSVRSFDVTNQVRNMAANVYGNHGWMIKMVNETTVNGGSYNSIEATTIANRPKLVVSYYLPFEVSAATITPATSSVLANGSISSTVINGPSSASFQWYDGATNTAISGATTSTLNNVKYGWYGLKISGSQGDPVYMAFLVGIKCQTATINFAPDGNYFDDATIVSWLSESNGGGGPTNDCQRSSFSILNNTTYYNTKSYLKPRVWLDPNIDFTQVNLNLVGNAHNFSNRSNAAEIDIVQQPWYENNITWSNSPTFSTSTQELITATTTTTESKSINITSFINTWKLNNSQNYGMLLQLQSYANPNAGMSFHSSDATLSTNRPTVSFVFNMSNSSGCNPASIVDLSYAELKDKLDASYSRTVLGKFRFAFYEEENSTLTGKYVPFEIRNENNVIVASSTIDGVTTGSITPVAYNIYVNNFVELNISTVPNLTIGKYFTLIVTNTSGEKKYLRVLYQN